MTGSGILQGKRAVVFGASSSIGSAVAKEFAAEGAEVYLSGRNKPSVEEVKREIERAGGRAHASVVDALDDGAVRTYLEEVAAKAGGIDIEFNTWALARVIMVVESRLLTSRSTSTWPRCQRLRNRGLSRRRTQRG